MVTAFTLKSVSIEAAIRKKKSRNSNYHPSKAFSSHVYLYYKTTGSIENGSIRDCH